MPKEMLETEIKTEKLRRVFSSPLGDGELTCTLCLPVVEGHDKISVFYQRLGKECADFCEKTLLERCCQQKASEQVSGWEYSYRLVCKPQITGDCLEISVSAALHDKTKRHVINTHLERHIWSLCGDVIMPTRNKKKKLSKKDKKA